MALGTPTLDESAGRNGAPVFVDLVSLLGDTSYPTGGSTGLEAALEALVGAGRKILGVIPLECGGYLPQWDLANGKLKMFYGDNNNASDGPLIEVPNATALNGVTMKLLVLSK
mgnify:CR=1 FL=1